MGFMNESKSVRTPKDESSFSKIKTLVLSLTISIVAGVIYVLLIVEQRPMERYFGKHGDITKK